MPFDVAKMSGKWKFDSFSDNYPQVMDKMGVPSDRFEKVRATEFPLDISLQGNVMTSKLVYLGKTIENSLTMGEEGEENDTSGKKRMVTYTLEGDCLVSVYPDHDGKGLPVHTSRHFVDDDTIRMTIKAGDVEGWALIKRC
ncbi:fatty acid-binding protein 1-like [Branchiostoma lanceolatum]|uniref:fatty acid-binding protein 1-like n=1 Tax=Branchiostoma lanceolatum TaxID=7740 RepID=UPI003452DE73